MVFESNVSKIPVSLTNSLILNMLFEVNGNKIPLTLFHSTNSLVLSMLFEGNVSEIPVSLNSYVLNYENEKWMISVHCLFHLTIFLLLYRWIEDSGELHVSLNML